MRNACISAFQQCVCVRVCVLSVMRYALYVIRISINRFIHIFGKAMLIAFVVNRTPLNWKCLEMDRFQFETQCLGLLCAAACAMCSMVSSKQDVHIHIIMLIAFYLSTPRTMVFHVKFVYRLIICGLSMNANSKLCRTPPAKTKNRFSNAATALWRTEGRSYRARYRSIVLRRLHKDW